MITVVIPTYNRIALLQQCLNALNPELQVGNINYEVIVTDDSTEQTARGVTDGRTDWLKYTAGPRKGPAANRNNGARKAEGEWILFIDDDCIPDGKIIQEYTNSINAYPGVKVFEGRIEADRKQRYILEESPINTYGGHLWSCNFLIEKKLFLNILNGFDESYPFAAMEDVDLHHRIKLLNLDVIFIKGATVIHPWRLQTNHLKMVERRVRSIHHFYNKFPDLEKKSSFFEKIKEETRFYIKTILFNLIRFGHKGILPVLKAHFMAKRLEQEYRKSKLVNQSL